MITWTIFSGVEPTPRDTSETRKVFMRRREKEKEDDAGKGIVDTIGVNTYLVTV
jgi:hypothetical protein